MSRFISGSVNWLRRSFSEHDGGLRGSSVAGSVSSKAPRFAASFDEENLLPSLLGQGSSLSLLSLNKPLLGSLSSHFPSRILGCDLLLVFSTAADGFSLSSLYRRLSQGRHDSPAILLIEDTEGNAFGALVSEPFKVQVR